MCFCPLNLPQCTSDRHQPVQSGVFPVAGHDQTIDSSSHNPVAWITALAAHTWLRALGEGVTYGKQWCLRPFSKVCIILCATRSPHQVGLFTSPVQPCGHSHQWTGYQSITWTVDPCPVSCSIPAQWVILSLLVSGLKLCPFLVTPPSHLCSLFFVVKLHISFFPTGFRRNSFGLRATGKYFQMSDQPAMSQNIKI